MERPTGVTVVSILYFLGTLILVSLGITLMLGLSLLGVLASHNPGSSGLAALLAGLGAIAGVVFLVLAIVPAIVGYGLWNLKEWARIAAIVLCAIGLAGGVLGFLGGLLHFHFGILFLVMVRLAVNALIIWYLLQPGVKRVFA